VVDARALRMRGVLRSSQDGDLAVIKVQRREG
jgi:hypothetical protein